MLRRNTSTAAAMVPSSSLRSPPGIVTSVSPLDSRFITAVIAASGRDRPRPSRNASNDGDGQNGDGAENQIALRARRRRLIFGGVLDDFEHRDRLAGVILDLPEIERGGMAAELASRRSAAPSNTPLSSSWVATTLSPKVEESFLKSLPSNECTARSMPKRCLARSTNSLPKAAPTSAFAEALAVAHDRRHAEDAERLAARFDADDRLAGLDRLHHGGAARRDVVAEDLRLVNAVEHGRRRHAGT